LWGLLKILAFSWNLDKYATMKDFNQKQFPSQKHARELEGLPEPLPRTMEIIDSHTCGEPTRIVISGWPLPPGDSMLERREYLRANHDRLRQAVVCEPRGHSAIVGGLLTPPVCDESVAGIIFFNDVGYLGMCGHGLIGLVETLKFMGKVCGDNVRIDTPAGTVSAKIEEDGRVTLANVPAYLYKEDTVINVLQLGEIRGDVAYGGNWFFLVNSSVGELSLSNLDNLLMTAKAIRQAIADAGITGPNGEIIDHIEFYAEPTVPDANSRNFVLCPGNAYDRSPCGTGTSAKMACLYAKGKLKPGQKWVQESITGSVFEGWVEEQGDRLVPFIRADANVVSRATLYFDTKDIFCWGIE
jgi:4-hydroxyproline epimerase